MVIKTRGTDDAPARLVVANDALAPHLMREELLEPFGPDHAGQIDLGFQDPATTFFARIERHKQFGLLDHGLWPKSHASAADHQAGSFGASPLDDAIGVGQQEPLEQVLFFASGRESLVPGPSVPLDSKQLVPNPGDLTSDVRIDSLVPDRRREPVGLRVHQPVKTIEDIGRTAGGGLSRGRARISEAASTNEDVPFRKQGGDRRAVAAAAGGAGGDHRAAPGGGESATRASPRRAV